MSTQSNAKGKTKGATCSLRSGGGRQEKETFSGVVVVFTPFLSGKHAIKCWGREKIPESMMQDSFGHDIEGG
jgi:hypothetical protein